MIGRIAGALRSSPRFYAFYRWLVMFYKRHRYGLGKVHPTFYMSGASVVSRDLVAGPFSFMNQGCFIGPKVELGPYVMLGPRVAIVGGDHRYDAPGVPMIFAGRTELKPTFIGADAWIGYGSVVMAGVRVGAGAIVAAGSVVTHDVDPFEIWGGVPARKIRDRFGTPEERSKHQLMLEQPPSRGAFAARMEP